MAKIGMWEIRDEEGIVHSGTEEEMNEAWSVLTGLYCDLKSKKKQKILFDKWHYAWCGDIELLQVHDIHR